MTRGEVGRFPWAELEGHAPPLPRSRPPIGSHDRQTRTPVQSSSGGMEIGVAVVCRVDTVSG